MTLIPLLLWFAQAPVSSSPTLKAIDSMLDEGKLLEGAYLDCIGAAAKSSLGRHAQDATPDLIVNEAEQSCKDAKNKILENLILGINFSSFLTLYIL